ncbi:MAG TPA: bifunctional YncE family protein/alkaline phosphatase family protein [Candidatus Paceibacterota bacterium]|nr:bifunctional YncE family protein/alkaline phosphatase family protein [Candidatus Paceibacterota bacterium]
MKLRRIETVLVAAWLVAGCRTQTVEHAGPRPGGGHLAPTHQVLRPAGRTVQFGGRPVDLALAPDGRTVYVKDNRGLVILDAASWQVKQELKFSAGGSSAHGLVVSRDGARILASTAQNLVWELKVAPDGKVEPARKLTVAGPGGQGASNPCGLAFAPGEKRAFVCLSRNNTLAVLDLESGKVIQEIPVGVAPYDVVLFAAGKRAFVSNWGGRRPKPGERAAPSAGTDTLVDERGVAASGTVSVVDLEAGIELSQVPTGLHPCDLELSPDQQRLFVANANSDSVTVIEVSSLKVAETIAVRPDEGLAFGSAPNALSVSGDGTRLFVANGGNNAVAVIGLAAGPAQTSRLEGFIPTAWFPGAVLNHGAHLYIANVKGFGSRNPQPDRKGWNSHWHLGTVSKVEIPDGSTLAAYTRQVKEDARVPQMLRAWETLRRGGKPVPVPSRPGEASVFEHVVYIIKENRTYDQVLGDLPQGNGDASLCLFGREVTPNHHALAEQFVLLDNYYCNGVCSADGHAWAMEGYATDYLEKSFGGWTRSYPFSGDDPLSFAPSGFIWDHVLLHGLSFRNYGEMSRTTPRPSNATFLDIYQDYRDKTGKITFQHEVFIENLRRYSCPDAPGWQMRIPDAIRADVFLKEFADFEQRGGFPNFVIIFLPSDHTSGTRPGNPTPRAQVADNDLALGRIVERISHSRYWPRTCVFVIEDDPQNGFDHVDGHRSLCLVVSPYTKRGAVVSRFYNQTSVLHTVCRIFGIPPMNQMVATAPLMTHCFSDKPDWTPYQCRPNQIPLDEMNKPLAALEGDERHWALQSLAQPFDEVDRADEDTLNRILWHSVKGVDTPYPAHLAGAHGKGLKALGLVLNGEDDDD